MFCFVNLFHAWLGLPDQVANLAGFLLSANVMSNKELALMAVAVYAMHRATAYFPRAALAPLPDQVRDFFADYVSECRARAQVLIASSG